MFESNVIWIEFIVQISIVFPACTLFNRMVGFKRIWSIGPEWLPGTLFYLVWKIINEVMIRWPAYVMDDVSMVNVCRPALGIICLFAIMPRFLKGSILKRYFAYLPIEIIGSAAYIFRVECMTLIHYCGIYSALENSVVVLLIVRIILELLPFYLLMWLLRKPIKHYHDNELPKRGIYILGAVSIFTLEVVSFLLFINVEILYNWRMIAGGIVICSWFIFRIYFQKKENERMYLQKKLMENHYHSVKNQAEQMEHVRKDVGKLLEGVEQIRAQTDHYAENIREYERELKEIHQQLRKIDYCDNIVIDAVLHSKVKECEEKGINLTVEMQNMNLGALSEIDVFEVIYEMLDWAIYWAKEKKEDGKQDIAIKAKNIAGQFILEVSYPETEHRKRDLVNKFRRIKKKAQRLGGHCSKGKDKGKEKIIAGIPCE